MVFERNDQQPMRHSPSISQLLEINQPMIISYLQSLSSEELRAVLGKIELKLNHPAQRAGVSPVGLKSVEVTQA
jgi:hypothetical protein